MPRKVRLSEAERAEWVTDMREVLDTATKDRDGRPVIWQMVKHVTRSGMSRSISSLAIVNGEPFVLDYRISRILDWPTDQSNGGVKVSGVGMDMGFHLVYTLSSVIYRGQASDAGYVLTHRWL
jgi:hypothetical protein